MSIAPFETVITLMRVDDATLAAGQKLYDELKAAGVDVLLDDRDARAGVKFADAELIGFPLRVTLGPRGLKDGTVELTERSSGETIDVALDDVATAVLDRVIAGRA